MGNMRMNVQCARDQLVFGPMVHKERRVPRHRRGCCVPASLCLRAPIQSLQGLAVLAPPPPSHAPHSMNPHTYKAMEEEEEEKEDNAVLNKTKTLSKSAVMQSD